MKIGTRQELEIARIKDFGAYLKEIDSDGEEAVLLPKKELSKDARVGDRLDVFLYKDSSDRLIATRRETKAVCGEIAKLRVNDSAGIGFFLDIGLERDILLPFKECKLKPRIGDDILVYIYEDRSQRLAATTYIYKYLKAEAPYKKDDEVCCYVYEINPSIGIFVAIDGKYYGLIPKNECFETYHIGEEVMARVIRVRADGKVDVSPRAKAYLQIEKDAKMIFEVLEKEGSIGFDDKSEPQLIKERFGLSKNAFKRAIGHLLKAKKIILVEGDIKLA